MGEQAIRGPWTRSARGRHKHAAELRRQEGADGSPRTLRVPRGHVCHEDCPTPCIWSETVVRQRLFGARVQWLWRVASSGGMAFFLDDDIAWPLREDFLPGGRSA